jgi:UDPglucose 6-dehydrogenase
MIPGAELTQDPYECVEDADAVVLATEWPEYLALDWKRVRDLMRGNIILDGRNVLDRDVLSTLGFWCYGVGRPPVAPRGIARNFLEGPSSGKDVATG